MKIVLTGATGMVGKGVLLECLDDVNVQEVLVLGRKTVGVDHPKLNELLHNDLHNISSLADRLTGYDACFFCLGISAVGISKEDYRRTTRDLTLHVAEVLLSRNKGMTFIYVSGDGTATDEKSRMDWANVKGGVENALLRMGFKQAFMFRPGLILPKRGVRSSTGWYQAIYTVLGPVFALLRPLIPNAIIDTVIVGRAMLNVARHGYAKAILGNKDIAQAAKGS